MARGISHGMKLIKTENNGNQIWECPDCGRKFVITSWKPLRKTIINEGDETIGHFGGTGVNLSSAEIEDESFRKDFLKWIGKNEI